MRHLLAIRNGWSTPEADGQRYSWTSALGGEPLFRAGHRMMAIARTTVFLEATPVAPRSPQSGVESVADFTVLPLPPLLSVPALRRFMAPFTSSDADLEYRAMVSSPPRARKTPIPLERFH